MIKFLPLDFLGVLCTELYKRIKTLFTICNTKYLQVPEIFLKFKISIKYANEMTNGIIHVHVHSTQYYIMYIKRAILAYLQCRPLKLGRLIAVLRHLEGLPSRAS